MPKKVCGFCPFRHRNECALSIPYQFIEYHLCTKDYTGHGHLALAKPILTTHHCYKPHRMQTWQPATCHAISKTAKSHYRKKSGQCCALTLLLDWKSLRKNFGTREYPICKWTWTFYLGLCSGLNLDMFPQHLKCCIFSRSFLNNIPTDQCEKTHVAIKIHYESLTNWKKKI